MTRTHSLGASRVAILCPPPARFIAIEQNDHLAEVRYELGFLLS
jgi:hypothetical protein